MHIVDPDVDLLDRRLQPFQQSETSGELGISQVRQPTSFSMHADWAKTDGDFVSCHGLVPVLCSAQSTQWVLEQRNAYVAAVPEV